MRRRFMVFFLIALSTVFFWKDILSIALQSVVRYQVGCQMAYRALNVRDGKIILDDAIVLDSSNAAYHIRAEQICIDVGLFQKPVQIHVELIRPHVTVMKEMNRRSSWIQSHISVLDGTFEWHAGLKQPFMGQFSLDQNQLRIDANGGSFTVKLMRKGRIHCSFEKWNIAPLIQDGQGILSGTLRINSHSVLGHLRLEDGRWNIREWSLGAACIEWEGEHSLDWKLQSFADIFSFPDRMKIQLKDAFIAKGKSRLTELNGFISNHGDVGPHWEISNRSFSWEGKGFAKSRLANWLESRWRWHEGEGSCFVQQTEGPSCRWSLEFNQADPCMVQLVQDFVPIAWPCQMKGGLLSGKFSWEVGKEWNLQGIVGTHLDLLSPMGSLQCDQITGSFHWGLDRTSCTSTLSLENGRIEGKGENLNIRWKIEDGQIQEGFITGNVAHLPFESKIQGSLSQMESTVHFGPTELKLHGDWNAFSAVVEGPCHGQAEVKREGDQWIFNLTDVGWGALQEGTARIVVDAMGLVECSHLQSTLAMGRAHLQLKGVELRRQEDRWVFDLRAEHQFWDLVRLKGAVKKTGESFEIFLDPDKSHYLNMPIEVQDGRVASNGSIESLKFSTSISWSHLQSAALILEEIHPSIRSYLSAPISGRGRLEIDLAQDHPSSIQLQGEDVSWKGKSTSVSMMAHKVESGWSVDRMQVGPWTATFQIAPEEKRCKISNGFLQWMDGNAALSGFLSLAKCELNIESLHSDLHQILLSPFALEGIVDGKGYLSFDWHEIPEIDLDLVASGLKSGPFSIDNEGPVQIHFSKQEGLQLRGLNFQVHEPNVHSRIDWVQFDFQRHHWILHHCQMNFPPRALDSLTPKMGQCLWQAIDLTRDWELIADIDFASDFSSFAVSMKEGFIPLKGVVRHVQDFHFEMKQEELLATFSLDQALQIGVIAEMKPSHLAGHLFLQDSSAQQPLTIDWSIQNQGLTIQSIEGSCGGLDASFHAQQVGGLIGSARFQGGALVEMLPPRLGKILKELQIGKGYEWKGSLFYDPVHLASFSFKGLLSGKQCELLGYQVRTFLSQIEMDASHVRLFETRASDAAGILKIDEIQIAKTDGAWHFSVPQVQLLEYRPSLLQKVGCEVGAVGPLVIREMNVNDLKGQLDDRSSWRARGELNFINSFKREHTVFDLPSDFLGRIIGLDQELLIPVTGRLKFELKENRIHLTELEDAYSEGKRSKFFLVKEGLSPTIDLDGSLHIFITMKQYVLFKLTENFLLTLDGTIQAPSFHLQKKSKLLGLGVL